jgi:spore germination cell wall hydrolase CwlJ-like protein
MNKTLLILAAVTVSRCAPCPAGIVADTCFAEARGESKAGQIAVASVIYNRAQKSGKSLESVCLARRQFSCWNNGYRPVKVRNEQERAIIARFEAMEADMKAGKFKPSGVWSHYHALTVNPVWSKGMKSRTVIGRHVFGVTK